ncbi:MAG: Uma2 family endonuclease [Acidobacteria bacterium]|nr:Uma2 family endonuclease [Acidobacteriota bacterium]
MSAHPKHYYTLDEYFALEQVGDARYEYWDGDIVCMSGGSPEHGQIGGNIFGELHSQLKGGRCKAFTSEIAISTPTLPPYRYPDVSVACGGANFQRIRGIGALINPILIAEVLSPHTEAADRGAKFEAYRAIDTLQEYLLVSQDNPHITHYVKQENGEWRNSEIVDLASVITLNSINCRLSLQDIYDGITFS